MKTTITITIFLSVFLLQGCTEKTTVKHSPEKVEIKNKTDIKHENDIYEIVNLFLDDYKNERKISRCLVDKLNPIMKIPGEAFEDILNDSLFTAEDKLYIIKQSNDTLPFIIQKKFIPKEIKILPKDTLDLFIYKSEQKGGLSNFWKDIRKNYADEIVTVGKPLFSKDSKTVVVNVSYSCGSLCGHGSRYFLRKTENGWKIIKTTLDWIS